MADMNALFSKEPLIIDNGSGVIKAGRSKQEKPEIEFSSYVGRPKYTKVMMGTPEQDLYVGNECDKHKGLL